MKSIAILPPCGGARRQTGPFFAETLEVLLPIVSLGVGFARALVNLIQEFRVTR